MTTEYETEFQRKRRERSETIIRHYQKLRENAPDVSINRLCVAIAPVYQVTPRNIRELLLRHNIIQTRYELKPKRTNGRRKQN